MIFFINELIFFLQIFFIIIILNFCKKENNNYLLYSLFSISLLLINLMINIEIKIFNITTTTVEPFSVLLFWIAAFLYAKDNENGANNIIKNTIFINLFCIFLFITFNLYQFENNDNWYFIYEKLTKKTILSLCVSTLTFFISYFFERKIFNFLKKFINNLILIQSISISISQFLDTTIYAFLFFNKPIFIILQIIFFSYLIKLICIFFYTLYFLKKQKL